MSTAPYTLDARIRLSTMMFLQYMLLPVWYLPLSTYLDGLHVAGGYRAAILSSMALGCLASPLIGMVADRHFASEKVLAVLNLATAVLLVLSALVTTPLLVFLLLLAVMLCYMPTWGLTSSIAMSNSPAEKFPQVRVFGSIGWVAAAVFSVVALKWLNKPIDGTALTFYCGAAVALVAAVFSLVLPHTPPPAKGKQTSLLDVLGLRSLVLMKDFSFAVLIVGYLLVQIPFSFYFAYFGLFLEDKKFELLTFTMNWAQVAEMVFMLMVPLVIARVGLKWAMAIGLAALLVRFASLLVGGMFDSVLPIYVAILVHGLIFGFYFVGGQIYVDRKAPKETRAQAQAFLFLCYGVGSLVGIFVNEWLIGMNTELSSTGAKIYHWGPVWGWMTAISAVLLVAFAALFREKSEAAQRGRESAETSGGVFGILGLLSGVSAIILWFIVWPELHRHSPTVDAPIIANYLGLGCLACAAIFGLIGLFTGDTFTKFCSVVGLLIFMVLVILILVSRSVRDHTPRQNPHRAAAFPSLRIIGETTTFAITLKGKDVVEKWRKQGCEEGDECGPMESPISVAVSLPRCRNFAATGTESG